MANDYKNISLARAIDPKQVKFYTQLSDIEKAFKHFKKLYKGDLAYTKLINSQYGFIKQTLTKAVQAESN